MSEASPAYSGGTQSSYFFQHVGKLRARKNKRRERCRLPAEMRKVVVKRYCISILYLPQPLRNSVGHVYTRCLFFYQRRCGSQ